MTETTFVTLNDQRCTRAVVHVPAIGPWHAEIDLDDDAPISGRATLRIDDRLVLVGTVVSVHSGAFGLRSRVWLVAGGGGWGADVGAKAYHNDAGVKAILVAQDAARAVSEVLGAFVPARERLLGVDYVRDAGRTASQVLEDVIGADVAWWVGFDGITVVGQRPTAVAMLESSYQVLAYDPRARLVTLAVDDPAQVQIGTVIAGPSLPVAQVVREYEVQAEVDSLRILAWCGGDELAQGRLADLWRSLVVRTQDAGLFGLYRYRVVAMHGGAAGDGRVSLQAVRRDAGVPDIEPISQWPGAPGVAAQLRPGAEVLVAFIEGDRRQPVIVHYTGKSGPGFAPVKLVLGGPTGLPAAKQNDTVVVALPPGVFNGSVGGSPATGIITFPAMNAIGSITTGSSVVEIAP